MSRLRKSHKKRDKLHGHNLFKGKDFQPLQFTLLIFGIIFQMVIKIHLFRTCGECVKESNDLLIMIISFCWSVTACSKFFFFPAARPVIDHLPPVPDIVSKHDNAASHIQRWFSWKNPNSGNGWDKFTDMKSSKPHCSPVGKAPGRGQQRSQGTRAGRTDFCAHRYRIKQ